jgi:hypothetical protein
VTIYFPGRTATPITAAQPRTGDLEHTWTVLKGGLGLNVQTTIRRIQEPQLRRLICKP